MKCKYDVFISKNSKDIAIARTLSNILKQNGLSVFESEESLPQMGQAEYSDAIDDALNHSRHLLVICSKNENGKNSRWVKYEWQTFRDEVFSGRKDGNIVVIRLDRIPIADLAFGLRKYQAFDYQNLDITALLHYFRVKDADAQTEEEMVRKDATVIEDNNFEFEEEEFDGEESRESERIIQCDGLSFRMIRVEGGEYHRRRIGPFYIGQFPVTQNLWEIVMGNNPSHFRESGLDSGGKGRWTSAVKGAAIGFVGGPLASIVGGAIGYFKGRDTDDIGHLPVETIDYFDALRFVQLLSERTGYKFSLPTELEWEFAAKGGNSSKDFRYAGSDSIDDVAWYRDNSDGATHPVGKKEPNELGLYDMCGNVWEWTIADQSSPEGVRKGGSWWHHANRCEITYRYYSDLHKKTSGLGLRVILRDCEN